MSISTMTLSGRVSPLRFRARPYTSTPTITGRSRIESMYDSRFVRVWRMYLSSSIASFRVGSCQLYQIVFTRQNNNAVRWTRAGVYQSDA